MADFDNLSEINENFDTIKTLLNSIRAQGILNTSDVDKLLSGINAKLEKLNTEEDIDIIKIFLSELKQNFEERHSVMLSKFSAIESLFSNLLKNNSEMLKSSEVKELFDIIATNLSVFSREVVTQKESLTDIALRIDALRSDDSQKNEIVKNIALLKPDLERLNNGFDSVVLSLNDNFKTIIKTITTIDKTEYLDRFSDELSNIEMSTNTVLSALQMLDKKTESVDDTLKNVVTKEDLNTSNQRLFELTALNNEISANVTSLNDRYSRIESLADKIDASVSIVAGLKAAMEKSQDDNARRVVDELSRLEPQLERITSDTRYEEFKASFEKLLNDLVENFSAVNSNIGLSVEEIKGLLPLIKALDVKADLKQLISTIDLSQDKIIASLDSSIQKNNDALNLNTSKILSDISANAGMLNEAVKKDVELQSLNTGKIISEIVNNTTSLNAEIQKNIDLQDANITRVLNEIATNSDLLTTKIGQTQNDMSVLCEKNFNSLYSGIIDLKTLVSQIDENSVSANNAIFSSITDRLTLFENSLRTSLTTQEQTVSEATGLLVEQVANIKNLSGVIDYKMDSSVVELNSVRKDFSELKNSVDNVLALDFVSTVKDLKVDLYASKQEMINAFENSGSDLSEKFTNDIYNKYELLTRKLDTVEDEFKNVQKSSMESLQTILDKISSSIVDVLSYVSETKTASSVNIDGKIAGLSNFIKENNLSYVETVRDIVDVIRVQVENNMKNYESDSTERIDSIKSSVNESTENIKKEIKYSYSKLIEIQDLYNEIKEIVSTNNELSLNKFENVIDSTSMINSEFQSKLDMLKTILLDKISDFKQEFSCENADKISELKFSVENLYAKSNETYTSLIDSLRVSIEKFTTEDSNTRAATFAKILDNFVALKDLLNSQNDKYSTELADKVDVILKDFDTVKSLLYKVDENVDADMTRQLSIIESNFESLVSQMSNLFDNSEKTITEKLETEFKNVSDVMEHAVTEKLEEYKSVIENTFDELGKKAVSQSSYINDRIADLNSSLKLVWEEQSEANQKQLEEIEEKLSCSLREGSDLTIAEVAELKDKIAAIASNIEADNKVIIENFASKVINVAGEITNSVDNAIADIGLRYDQLSTNIDNFTQGVFSTVEKLTNDINTSGDKISENIMTQMSTSESNTLSEINEQTDTIKAIISGSSNRLNANIEELSAKIDSRNNEIATTGADISTLTQICASNNALVEDLSQQSKEQHELSLLNSKGILATVKTIEDKTSNVVSNTSSLKNDISSLMLVSSGTKDGIAQLEAVLSENMSAIKALSAEISSGELQTLDSYVSNLKEEIALSKNSIDLCKNSIMELVKNDVDSLTSNIEKETDIIVAEIVEQFDILKKSQNDDVIKLSSKIEETVNDVICSSIDELKSYLDIKPDAVELFGKLDALNTELTTEVSDLITNMNKMLDAGTFADAMSDYRLANEILVNSAVDRLNDKIQTFINENSTKLSDEISENKNNIEKILTLFDKKLSDIIVDKYEEIKVISNKYNDSFNSIEISIHELFSDFEATRNELGGKLEKLTKTISDNSELTNKELKALNDCFNNLRSQISNKSFDEAFQASINKQIGSLENLIGEQLSYIEDISDLCTTNLPDVTELNTLVKGSILTSINEFSKKLDSQDVEGSIERELMTLKSDLITQILNIFNQISFVTEQEEILDFIQEKHSELISVLSHLVTSADEIANVKDEIKHINEKISSIISADGDVDYVYSLQDLESDIANLRLALNDMKENNHSEEFEQLITSTDDIYKLVDSIKSELPNRNDFEGIAEDIESISTRTNKLILASDESYKLLQDNIHEFKLVIDDLDERTRNFAQESGIDRIDTKLNALNDMMKNGAKTNQIFNQIFEYLAEWVDNAGNQIDSISEKVESLGEIGQIKDILINLKEESSDNSDSIEMVQALETVFDKQTKRISSLESKIDRLIVETTVGGSNSFDTKPIEKMLNKFLLAVDSKISSQQEKIDMLESKLASLASEKETAQLTKKVGGMDRQIAKLNKSIEKIASHVVEK